MPRAKSAPRVVGPCTERGGTRFRIRIYDQTGQRDLYFSSLKTAQAEKRRTERGLPRVSRQLGDVVDSFCEDKLRREQCSAPTANVQRRLLNDFFRGYLDSDLSRITSQRAALIYEKVCETPTSRTEKPPAAASQHYYLKTAKGFFRWAVGKGYVSENPFKDVEPIGQANSGKKQLRFDEANLFISAGLKLYKEKGDALALASVTALLLGCRASEVLHLRVRDLDCGGTKLWVAAADGGYRGKTANAARNPEVPDVLRPWLLSLAAGKDAREYLFGTGPTGRPRHGPSLYRAVQRVCQAAGVPVVCTHSLRGLWATAGVRSGALSHAVASAMGHGSFAVTAKHYVQPGAIDEVRTQRLVQMLDLPDSSRHTSVNHLSAEDLLALLPGIFAYVSVEGCNGQLRAGRGVRGWVG